MARDEIDGCVMELGRNDCSSKHSLTQEVRARVENRESLTKVLVIGGPVEG
ncbi:MAG TPA: hypothetical protein VEI04_00610 [Syntrophobacteria bacterium]|nr:hypothetical protein [Syntrophobacteria bacterium]